VGGRVHREELQTRGIPLLPTPPHYLLKPLLALLAPKTEIYIRN
jgi:hypothetical protein